MKNILVVMLLGSIFLCGVNRVVADEKHFDPLKRNLITAQGEAEAFVLVDGIRFNFSFEVNKNSFDSSYQQSQKIIHEMEAILNGIDNADIKIIKGWDLIKQDKISFGSKGRKISNRLMIEVTHFSQVKMHEIIAQTIDKIIAVDSSISLESLETFLTKALERREKNSITLSAMKNIQINAEHIADALNRKLISPKRIITLKDSQSDMVFSEYESVQSFMGKSLPRIQKSFVVNSQMDDTIKISVNVQGMYELD